MRINNIVGGNIAPSLQPTPSTALLASFSPSFFFDNFHFIVFIIFFSQIFTSYFSLLTFLSRIFWCFLFTELSEPVEAVHRPDTPLHMKTCPLLTAVAAATTERDGEMSWTLSLSLRVLIAQIKTHLLSDSIMMSKDKKSSEVSVVSHVCCPQWRIKCCQQGVCQDKSQFAQTKSFRSSCEMRLSDIYCKNYKLKIRQKRGP